MSSRKTRIQIVISTRPECIKLTPLDKPVLVMLDTTERTEAVDSGSVRLVSTQEDGICAGINELLSDENVCNAMAKSENPFGRGVSSALIADVLLQRL